MAKHFKQDTGRSAAPSRPRRARRRQVPKRAVLTLVLALAVVGVAVGGVIAWLTASGRVENQFVLGEVTPTVNEKGPEGDDPFDNEVDSVKRDVTVTNNGNVPIYVRAQVNIYWVDENGNQLWDEPENDYTLDMGNWTEGADGFYYWTKPLDPKATTENLLDSLTNKSTDDYPQLVCDVAVQAIQADPIDAVEEAWGVTVDGSGNITKAGA